MLDVLMLREASVLAASALGAYTDWKTGYIYDWITLPLIVIGLGLNAFEGNYAGIALGGAVFGVGYLLYYTGKLGGGDVKLYSGIALALPQFNGGVFVLSAILYSCLAAIIFISTYYSIKYFRKGIDWQFNMPGIFRVGACALMFGTYFYFLSRFGLLRPAIVMIFGALAFFGGIFLALEKGIRKGFFLKKIRLSEAEEDEVLAFEFMGREEREKIGMALKGVLGEKEKLALEGKGVREILVYRNLPRLGPFIFIGCSLALALPGFGQLVLGAG